jgi:hypothetical protein
MSSDLNLQILRVLNGQAFSLGKVRLPAIPGWTRLYERAGKGLPTPNVEEQVYKSERPLRERRALLATILGWRNGTIPLPSNIRRCLYCATFFQVESQASQLYCKKPKACGAYYRMRKKKRADRERKLARLRGAWKMCREPDRKFKAARKAGVTSKFVSDAIRRGELPAMTPRPRS